MKKCLVLCVVSGFLGALFATWFHPRPVEPKLSAQDRPGPTFQRTVADDLTPDEVVNVSVYEKTNRGVVNITTKIVHPSALFFSLESVAAGAGSGSILDREGHVLTNYHVVEEAREVRVTLFNGDSYEASLVGADRVYDIAVLRIAAPPAALFPVDFGDSSVLRVGQKVLAIGNPFGLERTMTEGIVSSLNRSLPARGGHIMKSIIQIDAALNQGNSGGPLLDSHGRLIGMNTAIASPSRSGENTGVGFAIPSNSIRRVVTQLLENGRVIRPDTGITRVLETERGVVIVTLAEGGPAEKAGLRGFRLVKQQKRRGPFVYEETRIDRASADMIVAIDGQPVKRADDVLSVVEQKRPGEEVVLTVVREGRDLNVRVVLGAGE